MSSLNDDAKVTDSTAKLDRIMERLDGLAKQMAAVADQQNKAYSLQVRIYNCVQIAKSCAHASFNITFRHIMKIYLILNPNSQSESQAAREFLTKFNTDHAEPRI